MEGHHIETHTWRDEKLTHSHSINCPIKKRRKGNSDDVKIVENEDDSEDNLYAWNSDHEKIELAYFFCDANINPDSSDNEGIGCSKPAYEQERSKE